MSSIRSVDRSDRSEPSSRSGSRPPSVRKEPAAASFSTSLQDSLQSSDSRPEGVFVNSESAFNHSIESLRPSPLVFLLAILTSFSGFMFGYDTGYISGALVVIKDDLGHVLTSGDKELITAATSLGAFITACIGGGLADAFGRKWVITFGNVMFLVGGAMQTGAHTLWTMIIGRFIMGFGVGLASLVAPIYLSELAPTRFRGRLVVLNVLAITLGQLIAYAIGWGLSKVHNGWRILVGLSLIPSVVQMTLFVFMPETPRYLVLRGRNEQARSILAKIYSGADERQLTQKIAEIASDIPKSAVYLNSVSGGKMDKAKAALITFRHNLRELFHHASNRRALSIVMALQLFQQFSGWNALMYYSGTIFESVGFKDPTAVSIIIAGTNFVFTCVAFLIIDKVGRRKLLVGTMWGMSLGLVMCAIAFHFLPFNENPGADAGHTNVGAKWSVIVIVFMFFFAASYATGIGNVPWQQSEMLPMEVRGVGTSFATATNWAGSLVVSATFLTMLQNITGTGTFAFYAGICAVGEVLVYLFYPETAGLDLEEIQQLLEGGYRVSESIALVKRKKQIYHASR